MQNILVLAGAKQSGKSTSAKYIVGRMLLQNNIVKVAKIDDNGDLIVNAAYRDEQGNLIEGEGILDLYRRDYDFLEYASQRIWPFAKIYSFANILKRTASIVFGISEEKLFGSNDDKNELTNITWEAMFKFMTYDEQCRYIEKKQISNPKTTYLTIREFLQEFGTRVCRGLLDTCWIDALWRQILEEGNPLVIIDDCRYANEVEFCKKHGASVVYLTRRPFDDPHCGENELPQMDEKTFDYIIRNDNITLEEKHKLLNEILLHSGLIGAELT